VDLFSAGVWAPLLGVLSAQLPSHANPAAPALFQANYTCLSTLAVRLRTLAAGYTLLLPAASAPAAASPPQSVAVRFVVAQPLFPSAIPLPDSAGEALPACVVGAVGLLPRALRPAQTLREAALALLNQLAAAGALLLEPTGASASAGAGPDASARACGEEGLLDVEGGAAFELLLHGVSTREVPSLLGVAVGELSAALQHPDGFLYVALLQRARDRG
jgi:hypothetical protein